MSALVIALGMTVLMSNENVLLEPIFQSWKLSRDTTHTLYVKFVFEKASFILDMREKYEGELKLKREHNSSILVRLEIKSKSGDHRIIIMRDREVLLLLPLSRLAIRSSLTGPNGVRTALEWLIPPLVLLEKDRVSKSHRTSVAKEDAWYVYINLSEKRSGGAAGGVAVMKRETESIPRHRPRQIWHNDLSASRKWDILKWVENEPAHLHDVDFLVPADWRILDSESWQSTLSTRVE